MTFHLQRPHGIELSNVDTPSKPTKVNSNMTGSSTADVKSPTQPCLSQFIMKQFDLNSTRAQAITKRIGIFIAHDLRPISIVESPSFAKMLHSLEPRYKLPSRRYFADRVIPSLYYEVKDEVEVKINAAVSVALTNDGWTSRAAQSYVTTTAHFISEEWKLESKVLETVHIPESHTGENLGSALANTAAHWNTIREHNINCVVTDNAINMKVAVQVSELGPHLGCFAHTVNLASKRALSVGCVDRLLGRVRRIVAYFHRSPKATHILQEKLKLLSITGATKLIMDVSTRWNSYDMLERFLVFELAVMEALMSKDVRKDLKAIVTLSEDDITNIEKVVSTLKPLKTVTTILRDSTSPTVSLILPLKNTITRAMTPQADDSVLITSVKQAILKDLQPRYEEESVKDFLLQATALDHRFLALPFISEEERHHVFLDIVMNTDLFSTAVESHCQQVKNLYFYYNIEY